MKKSSRGWRLKKLEIDELARKPLFFEREVWFCHLGSERGLVVVLKKFDNDVFWAIPLINSSKFQRRYNESHYHNLSADSGPHGVATLLQTRLVDCSRLSYKVGEVAERDFTELKEKIKALLP
jgi:hypothetical protein